MTASADNFQIGVFKVVNHFFYRGEEHVIFLAHYIESRGFHFYLLKIFQQWIDIVGKAKPYQKFISIHVLCRDYKKKTGLLMVITRNKDTDKKLIEQHKRDQLIKFMT